MDITRIVVDSADRDLNTHPTPASYVVHLPYDIFNACSWKLVSAQMPPDPAYLVGAGAPQRVGVIFSAGQNAIATLPYGNYSSSTDLADALRDALNAAASSAADNQFQVTIDSRLDSFLIRSTTHFMIDALASKMYPATAQVLGLRTGTQYSAIYNDDGSGYPWLISAPFRRSFGAQYRTSAVLRLRLPSTELLVSASQTLNRAFAVLSPGTNDMRTTCPYVKHWVSPVSRVSRVHVEFVDVFGEPYDFQNQDHRLEFEVESAPFGPTV